MPLDARSPERERGTLKGLVELDERGPLVTNDAKMRQVGIEIVW